MKMEITKVKIKLRNKAQRGGGGYYGGSAATLLPSLSDYVTGEYLIENYVAREKGMGLSANNFTDDLLAKLNGIEAGANKYVHPTATATTISAAAGRVLSGIAVNSLGHITSVASKTLTVSDIPALGIAKITGLQDALDDKVAQTDFETFRNLFDSMFEKVTENGVTSIKAKYGLWTESFLSARGLNSSGSGGSGGSYNRLDNWADYAADKAGWVLSAKLGYDLWLNKADKSAVNAIASRVTTLEGKNYLDALNLVTSGNDNAVVGVSLSADKKTLTVNKDAMARALYSISGTMNSLTAFGNALGMVDLQSASALVNPNGQTGWHHFINMSFRVDESNAWQTQIANAAGTTDLWVRSRDGGTISDSTAWKAPWTRILTGTNYASVLDARYYTKSEVDTKDKRLTTYYAARPTSANVNFGNAAGLYTFLATSVMTTGKPAVDSHILHMEWDNSLSYAAQLALPAGVDASMQWRWQRNTTWQAWRTLLDTNNYAGTLDTRYVTLDTAQPISGQKTFEAKVILKSPCTSNMGYSDTNGPRLEFHNGDSSQNLALIFTDFDSYRSPAGLKIIGNQGNEWLEAPRFIKSGGTSSQFLMADGSVTTKKTLSTVGNSGWTNQTADSLIVPTMSFIAYWDGSYSGGASNLAYCNKGRFGDIVTHSHSEYVTALGTSGNYLTWTKNGVANNITIPYATTAARLVGTTEHTGTELSNFDTTYTQTYQVTNDLGDGISYMAILSVSAGSQHRYFQIIGGKGDVNYLRWRTTDGNGAALGPVHRILDDGNYHNVLNSRYVTLNTAQTIKGAKTFDKTGVAANCALAVGGTLTNISNVVVAGYTSMIQLIAGSGGNTNGTCIGFHNPAVSSAILGYKNTDVNNGYFQFNSDDANWYVIAKAFRITGGTSSQFLKADGSVDGTSYVNKAGDTMTGALLAPKVEVGHMYWDGTGIMPSTVGHLQYICGKADGRWANVFTRTINVTSTDLVSNLNADMLDGRHAATFVSSTGTAFINQHNAGTWMKILTFTITSNALNPTIAFTYYPTECNRERWVDLSINIRANNILFHKFLKGNEGVNMKCVGDGTTFDVWMQCNKASYDGYGILTHKANAYITSYSYGRLAFQDTEPTGTYAKTADISGISASAVKLQTARTINGTSFDGTADIVTSYWGATRTLWGQSCNGSGNVSGDIELAMSNASSNNNSGKLWFNGVLRGQTTQPVTGPYMMGMNVGTYGRKRLGVFQHNADSYTVEPTEVLSILPSGNVGIGTTSPAYKLDVNGIVRASDSIISTGWNQFRAIGGNYGFFIRNDGNHTYFMLTNSGDAYGSYNSLRPMYIVNSSGVVGFASSTLMVDPDGYATVQGTFYASVGMYSDGYVSARGQNTSDVRLKCDFRDFRASDIIRALRPVAFRWNELARGMFRVFDTDAVQYGLIAQEVMETAPWLVDTDMFRDGYMGVWYDKLIPVLLKGEIEILRVTEDHEERIRALERENEELRREITELQTR